MLKLTHAKAPPGKLFLNLNDGSSQNVTSHLIAFKLLNKALYNDNPKQIAWRLSIILYNHPKLSNDNTICTRPLEEREGKF